MLHAIKQCLGGLNSRRGNSFLLAAASFVSVTFGAYFFVLLGTMHVDDKDRRVHLYNATMIAYSLDNYVQLYLQQEAHPKNRLSYNNQYQYTDDSLSRLIDIDNGQVFTLDELLMDGLVTLAKDPTAIRLLHEDSLYDALASTVKIQFELNSLNQVTNIHYLVNLAGSIYDNNSPFDSNEPFFYLVSHTESVGVGTNGSFDLTNNEITLLTGTNTPIQSLLQISPELPMPRHVIQLPGDES